MFIFKRAMPVSYVRKNTAAQNATLAKLDSFLNAASPQLIYFLHRMFQDQQAAITYKELREAWLDGYEQEIRQWQEDYARFVEDRLSPMWEIAMRNGAQQYIDHLKERGILVYDDSDQDVRSWIRRHTAEFVTNIGEGTRQAIRSIVMHGQSEGWTADQMARAIRPCIGLTQPQAMANLRYQQSVYEALLENHPRMRKDVAARKAQEAALKYAAKQHRLRADTIANTELAYAYNMGAHESIRQAMKQNLMGPCEKVWSTSADPRVCERCKALSGKRIGFDEGFPGGNKVAAGYAIVPPAHPRCRCVVEYVEISAPVIKPLNVGGANGTIEPRKQQGGGDKIEWPKFNPEKVISKEQYTSLREYASQNGIALSGFRKFDGDISTIQEAIKTLAALRKIFPTVADERHRLTLILSNSMDPNDFAMTKGRHIYLNANAYRDLGRLQEEYRKLVEDGWFVKGTDWRAIIHHEFGHIVAEILKVKSFEVASQITGKEGFPVIAYMQEVLSGYAASDYNGLEIISEVFADMSTKSPTGFSRQFYEVCVELSRKER